MRKKKGGAQLKESLRRPSGGNVKPT